MYNNIGQKIKNFVKILVIIGWVLVGILGVVVLRANPLRGIIILLVGVFLVWVSGLVLYGFGELIDNSTTIRKMLEKENNTNKTNNNSY